MLPLYSLDDSLLEQNSRCITARRPQTHRHMRWAAQRCRGPENSCSVSSWHIAFSRQRVRRWIGRVCLTAQPMTSSPGRCLPAARQPPTTSRSRHQGVQHQTQDSRPLTSAGQWTRLWSGPRQNANDSLNSIRTFTTPILVNYSVTTVNNQHISLWLFFCTAL